MVFYSIKNMFGPNELKIIINISVAIFTSLLKVHNLHAIGTFLLFIGEKITKYCLK